ncbi:MAG: hypothetical protein IJV37_06470 [Bacteroidales bacterium]|nr:hypothetical protein [Bacteroidales bacterium]
MKKTLILMAALALSLTPLAGQGRLRVSILGDSYSTFSGYIPAEYEQWYTGDTRKTDVTDVRQTWWWKVISEGGYLLEKNDSYSGATISYHGYHDQDYSERSFITRLTRLGSPDILLIFGGTNDSWAGAEAGVYKYEGQTREDLFTFRPAMARLLSEAQSRFPNVRIVFLINTGLRKEIAESIVEICRHYGVEYLQLKDIGKQSGHPNIAGMDAIARQVIDALKK